MTDRDRAIKAAAEQITAGLVALFGAVVPAEEPPAAALLRVKEFAARMGIHPTTAYELVRSKRIKSVKLGPHCVRVPAEEVDRLKRVLAQERVA